MQQVTLPLSTIVDGRVWRLFSVEFKTADGTFSTYIHALSHDHAELMCAEMRETLTVVGQLVDVIPGGNQ